MYGDTNLDPTPIYIPTARYPPPSHGHLPPSSRPRPLALAFQLRHSACRLSAPVQTRPQSPSSLPARPFAPTPFALFSSRSVILAFLRSCADFQLDVDLTQSSDIQSRSRFPAPPTGHELMALFPAAAPESGPETRGGPTSGFFQRQERAFFAQAGKEIIRVRVEVDLPANAAEPEHKKPGSRSWSQVSGQPGPHQSPLQSSAPPPQPFPHSGSRPPQRGTGPVTSLFPLTSSHPPQPPPPPPPGSQHPPNLHPPVLHQPNGSPGLRTPPQDHSHSGVPPPSGARPEYPHEDYDDESWRKPIPYAERRRAGKHTKRVIVRT
ncbi:hypothetical protein AN958_05399 [Leucoagaricus sp. SymC.cos]|nr:hypothetical protein AN958_05399 [Leucoagaricus sp. SymC.cos]